jgi:hypothetical protein
LPRQVVLLAAPDAAASLGPTFPPTQTTPDFNANVGDDREDEDETD